MPKLITLKNLSRFKTKLDEIYGASKIPTKTSELTNDSGFITINDVPDFRETDPTVPDWAKRSTKPVYDYSEIKNTPVIPSITGLTNKSYVDEKDAELRSAINDKVDKVDGKVLSTNDYTDEDKFKLESLSNYDDTELRNEIPTKTSELENDSGFITAEDVPEGSILYQTTGQNTDGAMTQKAVSDELNNKADKTEIPSSLSQLNNDTGFITVDDIPPASNIPTKTSELENDSGFITADDVPDYTETDPTVPSWAKQENKPEYDYSEIKNTPVIPDGAKLYDTTGQNTDGAMTQKAVTDVLYDKADKTDLFSGSYNDLSDTPTIPSVEGLASETYVNEKDAELNTAIGNKVDKVNGKGLSSNDYTTAEKNKLANIEENANNYVLPSDVVQDSNYIHTDNNYTTTEKTKLAGLENYDDTDLSNRVSQNESDITNLQNNKQDTIGLSNKLITDYIDDENRTTKLVTSAEKAQITTNKEDITELQDGKLSKHGDTLGQTLVDGLLTIKGDKDDPGLSVAAIKGCKKDDEYNPNGDDIYLNYETEYGVKWGKSAQGYLDRDGGATFGTIPKVQDVNVALSTDKLVNPNALTIKKDGEVIDVYDGSEAKEIDIPSNTGSTEIPLYDTTGQSIFGPMTQKATTEEFDNLIKLNATQRSSGVFVLSQTNKQVNEGTEFVIQFDNASYEGSNYLVITIDDSEAQYSLWSQSYFGSFNNDNISYMDYVKWEANDIVRFRYITGFNTNIGSTSSGFIAVENITKNYYYGTSKSSVVDANKANIDASNLTEANVTAWTEKLGVSALPIGFVIYSSCKQNNAGLHLADGSELTIGGTYDAFCQYVINNQADFPVTDLATYQTELDTVGQCGKYVITDTYVKLPKITKQLESANSESELGTSLGAGLPNIEGSLTGSASQVVPPTGSESGALSTTAKSVTQYISLGGSSANRNGGILNFDASKSNAIYGNSDTVQTQATKYYCYIVVGTVTKTDIVVNIDNIATDLNNKIDKSCANLSQVELLNLANLLSNQTSGWLPQIKDISNVGSYSGYVQYDNILMQWGRATSLGGSSTSKTITLHKPYASSSSYSVVSYANSGPANDYMNAQRITSLTATSFKIQTYYSETGMTAFWFAIGFAPEEAE